MTQVIVGYLFYGLWIVESWVVIIIGVVRWFALREQRRHNRANEAILSEIRDRLRLPNDVHPN